MKNSVENNAMHYMNLSAAREFLKQGLFIAWDQDLWLLAWGECEFSETEPNDGVAFFVPDFFLEDKNSWLQFSEMAWVKRKQLLGILQQLPQSDGFSQRQWDQPEETLFHEQFSQIKRQIDDGAIKKAVPIVFERSVGPLAMSERLSVVKSLTMLSEGLMPYGFWTEDEGIIGASPEILFDLDVTNKRLTSMAIAGTRKNRRLPNLLSANADVFAEDLVPLQDDPKERYEHEIVVKDIEARLKTFGQVRVGKTFEWSLGPLKHLRTDIDVKLAALDANIYQLFAKVCRQLHPTPALGLASQTLHWHWLKKLGGEGVPRRRFGAPFGVILPDGRCRALVAIRNVQWFDGNAYLGSGCGIVPQSQLEREWRELNLKRESVKEALGL